MQFAVGWSGSLNVEEGWVRVKFLFLYALTVYVKLFDLQVRSFITGIFSEYLFIPT